MASNRTYIAAQVAAKRKQVGLTQVQLAERVDVNPVTISNIERAAKAPTNDTLFAIAVALGTNIGDFFPAVDTDAIDKPMNRQKKEAEAMAEILACEDYALEAVLGILRTLKK